jgi:hypothetical protein
MYNGNIDSHNFDILTVLPASCGGRNWDCILLIGQDWEAAPHAALLLFSTHVLSTMTEFSELYRFDEDTDSIL